MYAILGNAGYPCFTAYAIAKLYFTRNICAPKHITVRALRPARVIDLSLNKICLVLRPIFNSNFNLMDQNHCPKARFGSEVRDGSESCWDEGEAKLL